jgi:hypothetical protein
MAFFLYNSRTSAVILNTSSFFDNAPSESSKTRILDGLATHLEDSYLSHGDPNIPIQKATLLCARVVVAKLDFLIPQQWLNRCDSEKRAPNSTEDDLVAACQILEMNLQLQSDELLRGVRWVFETYTQYHLLTYLHWHLFVKPVGPSVERTWKAVDTSFEIAEHWDNSCEPGSKWGVLQLLKDKAMRIRACCDTGSSMINPAPESSSGTNIFTAVVFTVGNFPTDLIGQ